MLSTFDKNCSDIRLSRTRQDQEVTSNKTHLVLQLLATVQRMWHLIISVIATSESKVYQFCSALFQECAHSLNLVMRGK